MLLSVAESEETMMVEPAEPTACGSSETTVTIRSEVDIVSARYHGRALAVRLGFTQTDATLVATAISELARNIILYAGQGTILLKALDAGRGPGVLVIARDDGPGIADLGRALAGGYSTSGGLGLGLCGVRRLVDEFDLVSSADQGTTVTFKKWKT
jgi:serine/threonine-protein kinase RsbT